MVDKFLKRNTQEDQGGGISLPGREISKNHTQNVLSEQRSKGNDELTCNHNTNKILVTFWTALLKNFPAMGLAVKTLVVRTKDQNSVLSTLMAAHDWLELQVQEFLSDTLFLPQAMHTHAYAVMYTRVHMHTHTHTQNKHSLKTALPTWVNIVLVTASSLWLNS